MIEDFESNKHLVFDKVAVTISGGNLPDFGDGRHLKWENCNCGGFQASNLQRF